MLNCKLWRTHVDKEKKLGPKGSLVADPTHYRSLARALQYLTFTRPDLSYTVQQLSASLDSMLLSKVTAVEEAKELATQPLDELIGNLKVYEMILENVGVASKTTKEKVKSLALKAKVTREQTSNDSDSQEGSDEDVDKEEAKAFNLMARNFFPAGRYVVPTGKDNVIVSTDRTKVIPAGRTKVIPVEEHIAVQRETKARTILLQSVRIYVLAFYCAIGYGLSIRDSKKDDYVALQCDRSGAYRDANSVGEKRKRSTTSRLIKCPSNSTCYPWKEKFVSAWTDKYLHFGNRSSSRAEGAHAKLKKYLQVFTSDLHEVKKKISLAVEHEFNEIKVRLASERIKIPHDCNISEFRELLSRVSLFALKEIYKQYKKKKEGIITPCTGHFMVTMGLLCHHKISSWQGITLSMDLVHPHWRINTLSLNPKDPSPNDKDNQFANLLSELQCKYEVWPLSKKELATFK
ncbi:protein FAR1-related sequence 5 [Tanacetum coccineum]